jgi:outer membrane murein-binding lipoprotein Lpp
MKYAIIAIAAAGLFFAGCSEKSSEPKVDASVSVDTANTKDKLNSALEKTGDQMKKAGEEAKAKLQDAGDTLKAKAEEAKDKLDSTKKPSVDVDVKTK